MLGEATLPAELHEGVPPAVWEAALAALAEPDEAPRPDEDVQRLVDERAAARAVRDWATADRLRDELVARGWWVDDTPTGPVVRRLEANVGRP
jgi:cysteinyl-tRNA synthetase